MTHDPHSPWAMLPFEILEHILIQACMVRDGGCTAAGLHLVSHDVQAIVSPYRFHSICVTGETSLELLERALKKATPEQLANVHDVFLADSDTSLPGVIHSGPPVPYMSKQASWYDWHRAYSAPHTATSTCPSESFQNARIAGHLSSILRLCAPSVRALTLIICGSQRLGRRYSPLVFHNVQELSLCLGGDIKGGNGNVLDPCDATFPVLNTVRLHENGRSRQIQDLVQMCCDMGRDNMDLKHLQVEGILLDTHGYVSTSRCRDLAYTNRLLQRSCPISTYRLRKPSRLGGCETSALRPRPPCQPELRRCQS
jgi:hypothetical protein